MLKNAAVGTVTEAREADYFHTLIVRALAWRGLPLSVILTLQTVVALVTLHNSAFEDEALYVYAGRQLLDQYLGGPQVVDPFATYMSGHPDVYPLLAGALDSIGGLTLVRLFSLVAMLTATACVYWIGGHVFSRQVAIFGSSVFAMQGPVLFLSRLATYDAMCLGLLAVATVLAFKLSVARRPWFALLLGPTLVLAFFAKYAFLLWAPTVFAILALQTWKARGWLSAVIRVTLALIATGAAALAALSILGRDFIHALVASTL
jgi:4-amino-4-deoxy-L-arabinose transferase-like glycosyltransferase